MNPGRQLVRWPCSCGDVHDAEAWPTKTLGLVVLDAADGTCPNAARSHPRGQDWTVTHFTTGAAMPYVFGSPEGAMAAAEALGPLCDWRQQSVQGRFDYARAGEVCRSFGGQTRDAWERVTAPYAALNRASA